jgi:hypothetical protein
MSRSTSLFGSCSACGNPDEGLTTLNATSPQSETAPAQAYSISLLRQGKDSLAAPCVAWRSLPAIQE